MINSLWIIVIDFLYFVLLDMSIILLGLIIILICSWNMCWCSNLLLHLPDILLAIVLTIQPLIFWLLVGWLIRMRTWLCNDLRYGLLKGVNFIMLGLLHYLYWWTVCHNHHIVSRILSLMTRVATRTIITLYRLIDVFALSPLLTTITT